MLKREHIVLASLVLYISGRQFATIEFASLPYRILADVSDLEDHQSLYFIHVS